MTGPLSAILGSGLLGVFCIASVEKIFPAPPSHIVLLFLGMTAAPGLDRLELLLLITVAGSTLGSLFWYAMAAGLAKRARKRSSSVSANMSSCRFRPIASWLKLIAARPLPLR
ncbi:hypothetical protein [Mesorhizobium sp. Pch-S]|uniref:hypothetical protein n=1 Tax=Mesorhizobium sp. Pch-S TaxID=2082387 RepID=UPI001FE0EC51|nr:hypothetical protein [Mesorhizobium sp. Pch-S]